MLSQLIGPVTQLAFGWLKNKAEEKEAAHKSKIRRMENDSDWELRMADASAYSWKDEFWTLVLAAPIFMISYGIAADDPSVIERVKEGFRALSELPVYYQYLLGIAILASFGFKSIGKLVDLITKK